MHREAQETWDESADLVALSRTGICVVCAGVKSILDVAATLERLETLGVGVAGYGTDRFPGFYLADSGHPSPWRLDSPEEVAAVLRARARARPRRARWSSPTRSTSSSTRRCTSACWPRRWPPPRARASAAATSPRSCSRASTRETGGASLRANVRLVLRNAELAGADRGGGERMKPR